MIDRVVSGLDQLSGHVIECPPGDWEVVGLILSQVITKSTKVGPSASLLGTQHQWLDLEGEIMLLLTAPSGWVKCRFTHPGL